MNDTPMYKEALSAEKSIRVARALAEAGGIASYSQLAKISGVEGSLLIYHLNRLQSLNLIETPVKGTYRLKYKTPLCFLYDSTEADVGSVSLACLSCHDGTQAMDSVINLPGSGGWVASGSNIDLGGIMTGVPVPMLGTDLSDDHPISIPYAAGGCLATDTDGECTATLGDADFFNPWKATINAQPVWWVNTDDGASTAREKLDLPLYTRLENAVAEPFVECGSCHDPHNAGSSGATTVAFLRTTNNAASKICVACHNK